MGLVQWASSGPSIKWTLSHPLRKLILLKLLTLEPSISFHVFVRVQLTFS
jgi:hypothetical protein